MRKLIHSAIAASWVRRAPSIVGIYSMTHSFERVLFTWPAVSMCAFSGTAPLSCRQRLPEDFFN